jgi:hypothetical protein
MTEFSSAELCKLSVQEVADLLLDKLGENLPDKEYSCAKLYGCNDGRMFELCLVMREVSDDDSV